MRHKGYRYAVQWIAHEDEPTVTEETEVRGMLTVALVADLYGKETYEVAADVLRVRVLAGKGAV